MKLMIRFADQIVGALIIIAVGILVFVIFMLGSSQRWFVRDNDYVTYFGSASGLSTNMPVLYKGYTIGRVKKVEFNMAKDRMDVQFTIFKEFTDKVKKGSRVDLQISPISALGGNQFLFYPGKGTEEDPLPSGTLIPPAFAPESQELPDNNLVAVQPRDDSIVKLISEVGTLLGTVNESLGDGQLKTIVNDVKVTIGKVSGDLDIEKIMSELMPAIENFRQLSAIVKEPDNALMAFLNSQGDIYGNIVKTLEAASGTVKQLEFTTGDIHSQTPQIAASLDKLLSALKSVNQVLDSVKSMPLIKNGVPEQTETKAGGSGARNNTEF